MNPHARTHLRIRGRRRDVHEQLADGGGGDGQVVVSNALTVIQAREAQRIRCHTRSRTPLGWLGSAPSCSRFSDSAPARRRTILRCQLPPPRLPCTVEASKPLPLPSPTAHYPSVNAANRKNVAIAIGLLNGLVVLEVGKNVFHNVANDVCVLRLETGYEVHETHLDGHQVLILRIGIHTETELLNSVQRFHIRRLCLHILVDLRSNKRGVTTMLCTLESSSISASHYPTQRIISSTSGRMVLL